MTLKEGTFFREKIVFFLLLQLVGRSLRDNLFAKSAEVAEAFDLLREKEVVSEKDITQLTKKIAQTILPFGYSALSDFFLRENMSVYLS